MDGLVGYGTSSESEEEEPRGGQSDQGENTGRGGCGPGVQKIRNFLLESRSGSSESDSEPDPEPQAAPDVPEKSVANPSSLPAQSLGRRLPPPPSAVLSGSSVFANPFREQTAERLSILEKHVPLTPDARPSQIGGRKMCISYRRDGRCRFGSSCKFAHDSDLQRPVPLQGGAVNGPHGNPSNSIPTTERDWEGPQGESRKKRRVGLSDTLLPPKRALKQYDSQRKEGFSPFL
ncbi:uncharacterized protein LOC108924339 [Scleropages formosus]|uniref:uncharacterized protein LOC108924339 n=1 Tax=Scleropages formosus TaxID=113540 RepID=UPI0010FAA2E3|nr:uncharacterized protein LOC108924339 [Scleropages formosus]